MLAWAVVKYFWFYNVLINIVIPLSYVSKNKAIYNYIHCCVVLSYRVCTIVGFNYLTYCQPWNIVVAIHVKVSLCLLYTEHNCIITVAISLHMQWMVFRY